MNGFNLGRASLKRRIAEEQESTSDLAYEAARKAINDAGVNIEQIDLVIVATITRYVISFDRLSFAASSRSEACDLL